ncbi:ATP-grasp fold amidoligase family protein [Vibrio diabolicus]|uniref:ATP-grasp fold amidoligase family protein n=1 Tax=Vibrio diabolicus TaxID=50719 RepID=UPI00211B40B4|nr:ATP-grasp fold amidoligase family protein [Vibrio diabolicus]MCG6223059.1 hypothetical protein [Vibrio diabolicus]
MIKKFFKVIIPSKIIEPIQANIYERNKERYFYEKHGYQLNITSPESFSQNIFYRKYHGNFEEMARYADKYIVRNFVEERVGKEYLIKLLGVYDHITLDDLKKLPKQFVIKTNHGTGEEHLHIVTNKAKVNLRWLAYKMNQAVKKRLGNKGHEPFYNLIQPKILVEEYLKSESITPEDYKFHCFKNKVFIQVDSGRYVDHKRTIFDKNWVPVDMKLNSDYQRIDDFPCPSNFEKMLEIANKLSQGFDYIRVDLYNIDGKIYFGELTQTHGNGLEDFKPTSVDFEWGQLWNLDKNNRHLYSK